VPWYSTRQTLPMSSAGSWHSAKTVFARQSSRLQHLSVGTAQSHTHHPHTHTRRAAASARLAAALLPCCPVSAPRLLLPPAKRRAAAGPPPQPRAAGHAAPPRRKSCRARRAGRSFLPCGPAPTATPELPRRRTRWFHRWPPSAVPLQCLLAGESQVRLHPDTPTPFFSLLSVD
jgi:hypothetical protein